ncbi:MAG: sel1 repeat family protein, partial [Clostridia bacterium]|nr:sel1 repeat family protein [Clostridia bacterium]
MDTNVVTYEQAVDLCNRAGMRFLTYAKKVERGAEADETEVKHDMFLLYFEAAKSGLPRAHYNLGVCYHFGIGVGVDHEEAIKNYEKAIAGGSTEALVYLSKMYAVGEGVEIDRAKADSLLAEAADKGNPTACFILGGHAANDKNSALALSYFKKAAESHKKYSYCSSVSDAQSGKDYESARDGVGRNLS